MPPVSRVLRVAFRSTPREPNAKFVEVDFLLAQLAASTVRTSVLDHGSVDTDCGVGGWKVLLAIVGEDVRKRNRSGQHS